MPRHSSIVSLCALLALGTGAAAQILSVPPAYMPAQPPAAVKSAAQGRLLLPEGESARRISLPPPSPDELKGLKAQRAVAPAKPGSNPKLARLQIGFSRSLAPATAAIRLADLSWQLADGAMRAAQITVTSPAAASMRIAVNLNGAPSGLVVRFKGSGASTVFGPYAAETIAADTPYWSPVLEGDTATLEFALPAETSAGDATLVLPMLSHLALGGGALKQTDPLGAINRSSSCEIDIACLSADLQQQAASAINAVARVVLTDLGGTFLCTGTLLNDSTVSSTPYLYTANHCIDDGDSDPAASRGNPAAVAKTISTYWFFQTLACGVHTAAEVNFVQVTGGTALLGRSVDNDWALLRLNQPPPSGATFAAWNASTIAPGTSADVIHHPKGDLKKFSQGNVARITSYPDGSSFITMQWNQGVTEPGSSGSGLFTLNTANNYFELRGGLYGGSSSCTLPKGLDDFSRLDLALPLLTQYLTPGAANPAKTVPVVEFYNASLDDYFITASAAEIGDLDSGVHAGWVRTGLRFLAYSDPSVAPADVMPVCRFYVAPAYGDSHFYSANPAECAATQQKFAGQWIYETAATFYLRLPNATTGACAAGSHAVYRFLNNANGLHHRYTAEVDVRDAIRDDGGWTQEGYGAPPNQVVMCSPNA